MVQWEVCLWADVFECLCVCVCVQYCFAYYVCCWINRAWMMMTTFIACLIKRKMIACVQSMKCDNLFIDSCPVSCTLHLYPVLVYFCWVRLSSQHASLCKTPSCEQMYVVLLVTKCLCVTCLCPSDALSCVREILCFLFAKCGMFCSFCFIFSMILTLLWSTHIVLLTMLLFFTDQALLYC